jgi:hypothetical protein
VEVRPEGLNGVCGPREGLWPCLSGAPLRFVVFMDRTSRSNCGQERVQLGDFEVRNLLFAEDVVLLASTEPDLQRALDRFATECQAAGISYAKTEVMLLSKGPGRCALHVSGASLNRVENLRIHYLMFYTQLFHMFSHSFNGRILY